MFKLKILLRNKFIIFSMLFFNIIILSIGKSIDKKLITIMIDPAGDAKTSGRIIENYFERGITLQFAQAVKQDLELRHANIRVVLTRFPGETIEPLQNASFSNRLNSDLYISLHFYPKEDQCSDLSLYYFRYSLQDNFIKNNFGQNMQDLDFKVYNKAYKSNFNKTINLVAGLNSFFIENSSKYSFDYKGSFGIPVKPLMGIIAPAILFEIGISKINNISKLVKPMADIIYNIIESLKVD